MYGQNAILAKSYDRSVVNICPEKWSGNGSVSPKFKLSDTPNLGICVGDEIWDSYNTLKWQPANKNLNLEKTNS